MRGHAKASSARSTKASRIGTPKAELALAFIGALALVLVLGVSLASAVVPTVTIEDAKEISYTSALAEGTVDPQGKETNCHFEYISQAQLDENVGNGGGEFDNAGGADCNGNPHEGTGAQNVEAQLSGLTPSTVYHLRLLASNEDGQSEAVAADSFETEAVAKPTVTINPVTTFTGTTAHFTGKIEPEAPASELAAFDVTWSFQCVPDCPGLSGGTILADSAAHVVQADASGLEPNTPYEVTLLASNAGGSESAGPVSFTTEAVGPTATTIPAFVLEGGTNALVGGRVNSKNSPTTYWVEYGTTTGYGTSAPLSKDAAAGSGGQDKVVTQEITGLALDTTYHYRLVAKNAKGEVKGEDLSFKTPVPASGGGSCPNAALRTGPSAGLPDCRAYELVTTSDLLGSSALSVVAPEGSVRPWGAVASDGEAAMWTTRAVGPGVDSSGVDDAYLSRRSPAGWTSTPASPPGSKVGIGAPFPVYATPNLDRIVWATFGATIDPADPDPVNPANPVQFRDLYRREPDGSFTWLTRGSDMAPVLAENQNFGGASIDALKVLFADPRQLEPDAPEGGVYERVGQTTTLIMAGGTVQSRGVSADGSVVALGPQGALYLYNQNLAHTTHVASFPNGDFKFELLSDDGSKAFFTTTNPLTPDDTDGARDVYEYDADTEALTRISAPTGAPAGPGPGNGQAAEAVAFSADGSKAYFVSREQLDGAKGTDGAPNLYLSQGGVTHFVTTLDGSDSDAGFINGVSGSPAARHVRLTPDGSKLLFESRARITAYDNAGHNEVYVYDSGSDILTCASCRPSGEPPSGDASLREPGSFTSSFEQFSGDPMYLANSDEHGERIFFHSSDSILPQDINGKYDVYEFDAVSGAESLISTGKSPADSAYYGNSTDGRDVFFFTLDSLVSRDPNQGSFKVYDARVGGGFAEPPKPAPCEGEACRSSTSAKPAEAPPATPSFIGPGNPKPKHAKKHKAKKHKSHKKQQSKSHKRAADANGRTGR